MGASPQRQRRERRLGQLMVEFGLLTEEELATALAEQRRERRPLGEVLVALGFASSAAVHDALSEQHGWSREGDFGLGTRLNRRLHAVPDAEPVSATPPAPEPPGAMPDVDAAAQAEGDNGAEPPLELAEPPEEKETIPRLRAELDAARRRHEDDAKRIAALEMQLGASEAERARLEHDLEKPREPGGPRRATALAHRLFAPTVSGYAIVDRAGPAPELGADLELELEHVGAVARYVVSRVARPALPGATEAYVYLQPA